jgi:Flp pilus assembly protein TadB
MSLENMKDADAKLRNDIHILSRATRVLKKDCGKAWGVMAAMAFLILMVSGHWIHPLLAVVFLYLLVAIGIPFLIVTLCISAEYLLKKRKVKKLKCEAYDEMS